MAQCDELTRTPGTNLIFVMSHDKIGRIPKDRTVTYARIVVDFRPQKADPNRVRIMAGGNLMNYPHETTEGDVGHTQLTPPVTTTNDPTDPQVLRRKSSTHLQKTRTNTPGHLSPISIIPSPPRWSTRYITGIVEVTPSLLPCQIRTESPW